MTPYGFPFSGAADFAALHGRAADGVPGHPASSGNGRERPEDDLHIAP